jgi:O-antigen/teichoic acid export membrane protein
LKQILCQSLGDFFHSTQIGPIDAGDLEDFQWALGHETGISGGSQEGKALKEKQATEQDSMGQVAAGAGVLLPATLIGTVLLLLHDMLVNGNLSTAEYGLYATSKRVLQIGFLLGFLGLENAVVRFVSQSKGRNDPAGVRGAWRKAQAWSLGASAVLAALLVLFANPIAGLFDSGDTHTSLLPWALRILAICLPLAAIRMMSTSASQGLLVMWPKALILQVAWPSFNILGVYWFTIRGGHGIEGVLWAYDLSMLVGALLGLWSLRRISGDLFSPKQPGRMPSRTLWAFAAPLWIYTIVNGIYAWLDQLVLASMAGMEMAGIYAPVAILAPLFPIGLMALNGIFAPVIASLYARGERKELERVYKVVARWSLTLGLPLCVGALVAPEAVIGIWPSGRVEAVVALQVMAAGLVFPIAVGSVNYMLIMSGHQRHVLWNGIPGIFVNLGLAVWLIPDLGITGAAIANVGALIFISAVAAVQVWILLGMHPFSKGMIFPLLASVPAAAGGWWMNFHIGDSLTGVAVVAIVGVVIATLFGICLAILGFDEDDRALFRRLRRRP